jgi:hypothetical protein
MSRFMVLVDRQNFRFRPNRALVPMGSLSLCFK